MTTKIYHNPRCSKSRATLALLQARDIEIEIIEYQLSPPTPNALQDIVEKLGCQVADVVRFNEPAFRDSGLGRDAADDELLALIAAKPILLERPIVVVGDRARIGRPPEAVLELFE